MQPWGDAEWTTRLQAVGRAQARYLWLFLVFGVFYFAVDAQVRDGPPHRPLIVPGLGLEVTAVDVWATGPLVLAFLLLAYLGAVRAAGRAARALRLDHPGRPFEALDTSPNAIDLAMYTTSSSPRSIQFALGFVLPLATSLALLAVFYLTLDVGASREADGWALAGALLFLPSLCLVVEIWGQRVRRAYRRSS